MSKQENLPRLFYVPIACRTPDYHRRMIARARQLLDEYENLESSDFGNKRKLLDELDGIYLALSMSCRNEMELDDYCEDEDIETADVDQYKNIPVTVVRDGDALRIKCPFLYQRENEKRSYAIAALAAAAIESFERKNGPVRSFLKGPLHTAVIRKTDKFRRRAFRDNDNMEVSNIINRVFRAAFAADDALNMSFSSHFRVVPAEDSGMEFLVFPQKDIDLYKNELFLPLKTRK